MSRIYVTYPRNRKTASPPPTIVSLVKGEVAVAMAPVAALSGATSGTAASATSSASFGAASYAKPCASLAKTSGAGMSAMESATQ